MKVMGFSTQILELIVMKSRVEHAELKISMRARYMLKILA